MRIELFDRKNHANDEVVEVTVGELRRLWRDTVDACETAADRYLDPYWYEHTAWIEAANRAESEVR